MAIRLTKDQIREKITTNARWLEHAIVTLYNRQEPDEQNRKATVKENGVGFNATDAEFMSSLAVQIINNSYPEGQRLSRKQQEIAFKKIGKYAGQLERLQHV